MKSAALALPDEMVDAVARRFRLLGEPVRLRLLQLLESGEHTVNELAEKLQGNQANISRHLTAMHEGGLLKRRPDGTSVYYSIADPMVLQLCDLVCKSTQEQIRIQLGALSGAAGRGRKAAPRGFGSRTSRHSA
jgi:DNA-binding transcriptional ArsR family regulator